MKVRDLIGEIEDCKKDYPDFLDWDVYTEQICEEDKRYKKEIDNSWKWVKDSEDWEYVGCAGFWTKFPEKKIFTINVNY